LGHSVHDGDRLSKRPVYELRGRRRRDREVLLFDLQQRSCCQALPARTLAGRQSDHLHHRVASLTQRAYTAVQSLSSNTAFTCHINQSIDQSELFKVA